MLTTVAEIDQYLKEAGLDTEAKLKVLGSVARLNPYAMGVKTILSASGLSESEQREVLRLLRPIVRSQAR